MRTRSLVCCLLLCAFFAAGLAGCKGARDGAYTDQHSRQAAYNDPELRQKLETALAGTQQEETTDAVRTAVARGTVYLVGEAGPKTRSAYLAAAEQVQRPERIVTHWFAPGTKKDSDKALEREAAKTLGPEYAQSVSAAAYGGDLVLMGELPSKEAVVVVLQKMRPIKGIRSITSYLAAP